jgi:site-specific recombinase XerD
MKARMAEYLLSLHGIKERTEDNYLSKVKMLGTFLTKHGIMRFEDANSRDIDFFLSQYNNESTLNVYIHVFRCFYDFLNLPEVVSHLRLYYIELEQITPSETLTPDEVISLANEAGKRRELYKVLILILYESCARVSEILRLRLGDVAFSSVADKEGHRKLVATLHFKRTKGGVKKQPVLLVMFSSELKRWVDNHPYKGDKQAWLFPSPFNNREPVTIDTVEVNLWNAGNRIGIKKRLNPHWLRHCARV